MTARVVGRTGTMRGREAAVGEVLTVGSAAENDLRVELRTISRRHAQIVKTGSEFYVEDLGSRNGTFLNGQRVKRFPIRNLDVLSLGPEVDLIFLETGPAMPVTLPAVSIQGTITWLDGPLAGRVQEVPAGGGLILGRGAGLPVAAISRRHAALTIREHRLTVEDLGSANGTWVNGIPIKTVTTLSDGDELALGNLVRCRVAVLSSRPAKAAAFEEGNGQETIDVGHLVHGSGDLALEIPRSMADIAPAESESPRTAPTAAAPDPPPVDSPPPAEFTIVAPPAPAAAPPAIAQAGSNDAATESDGTRVAPRAPASVPSFSGVPAVDDLGTIRPPLEPAGGVPRAIASRARAVRNEVEATVTPAEGPPADAPPVAAASAPLPEIPASGGSILGVRLEGPKEYTLKRGTFTIGRHPECDVHIDLRDLGRRHARLTIRDEMVTLEDLGSANGSFLNDTRVSGTVVVEDGGRLRFATVELTARHLRSEGDKND